MLSKEPVLVESLVEYKDKRIVETSDVVEIDNVKQFILDMVQELFIEQGDNILEIHKFKVVNLNKGNPNHVEALRKFKVCK